MARPIYPNPPIEEATCQFAFSQALPWNIATPGRLFERLKSRYPAPPTHQQLVQANLTPGPGGEQPHFAFAQSPLRVQFANDDKTNLLTVGPDLVAVHRSRPYLGFKAELLPRLREDLSGVLAAFECEPSFSSVGVRYINRICINDVGYRQLDLQEYFNYWNTSSVLPAPFDGLVTGFFYKTVSQAREMPQTLNLTFGSVEAPKDTAAFVLDIDLTHHVINEGVGASEAIELLAKLKSSEGYIFESLITDKCRELFR